MMDDAEIAVIVLNSSAGTSKHVVSELRAKGIKAGVIKPRVFRPFPVKEIAEAVRGLKAVAVLDKADGLNAAGGPLFSDVTSAMLVEGVKDVNVVNYIYGIGGRDVTTDQIEKVFSDLQEIASNGNSGETYRYLGLKE
jgi:Pyruvate:ferredoxin oxidoreductase and related 2-oxoacid:ferredoxin oxidoreductases, alpha subunit